MSSETLRRAAALMRERANDATGSPWQHIPTEDEAGCSDAYVIALTGHSSIGEDVGESMTAEDAQHIASWHPAVALAVADLLDLAAGHEKREGEEAGQGYTANGYGYIDPSCSICGTPDEYAVPWPCAYATRGLAVARAYLNEEA